MTLTQEDFTKNLVPLPTSPEPWAGRKNPPSLRDTKMPQRKLGEPSWVATESRRDICECSARTASKINALCGSHINCINEVVRVAEGRQQATELKYAPPSRPWKARGGSGKAKDDVCDRGGEVRSVSMSLVGRSVAVYGRQSTGGKSRLGYAIGLMSSTSSGPCHILQWTSNFSWKLVKSSVGREAYGLCEMVDHMLSLKDFFGPLDGLEPGMVGLGDCGNLVTHLKKKKMTAGKYKLRHFLRTRRALVEGELGNVYWARGTERPRTV